MRNFFRGEPGRAALLVSGIIIFSAVSCGRTGDNRKVNDTGQLPEPAIVNVILKDTTSFYWLDAVNYTGNNPAVPIGVFDSGTGGLTVLEAILALDMFNNSTGEPGSDNLPDFSDESFTYLADQANMPYGVYYAEGKSDLLVEHIIKDLQFLLGERYYAGEDAPAFSTGKQPVKAVVVACNTATAYGMTHIESFLQGADIGIRAFGVIDAGARGALQCFGTDESGTVGVMATVGTVASGGYESSINRLKEELGYRGNISVISLGGHGIAEAVDEEPDFYNRNLTSPRGDYKGPSVSDTSYPIDRSLLEVYNFDYDDGKMLCDADDPYDCTVMQINDPGNYIRYHLVTLFETMRRNTECPEMKAIILGCTHYPYLTGEIRQVLDELYNFKRDGNYVYRHLMAEEIELIDPSVNVATELYEWMRGASMQNAGGGDGDGGHRFFISVPNRDNPSVVVDAAGRFTYEYKYGRQAGEIQEYVKVVPFSPGNISDETLQRLERFTPYSYKAIINNW
jgi:glutamate racemase